MRTASRAARRRASRTGAAILSGLLTAPCYAAGIWLYEQGTPDMGMANAGRAALAENAATASGNPAGMTRLEGTELLIGIQPMLYTTRFDQQESSFGGGNGGNAGALIPGGAFYFVRDMLPKLKLGFSASSFFGAGLDYSNDWAGRYYATEVVMFTVQAGPSLGYRINDQWSVGAGAYALYADLTQKARLNNAALDPGVADGSLKLSADDWGYGGRLGVLFEPASGTRLGLQYSAKVKLEFKDRVRLNNLGPTLSALFAVVDIDNVNLKMNLPQSLMFSAFQQLNRKWDIAANVGWQDWSDFGKMAAQLESTTTTTLTADRNFKDTWHGALGVRCRYRPGWRLSTGFAYDSSPVSDANRTPDMPLDRQLRFAVGLEHERSEDFTLGVAYEYLNLGDAKIEQEGSPLKGSLKGKYSPNAIHLVNFTLAWRY